MSSIFPVSKERHKNCYWKKYQNYNFASETIFIPVLPQELATFSMIYPVTFLKQNNIYIPVMLAGISPSHNLFILPNGSWSSEYVPKSLTTYPFTLAKNQNGEVILCVEEAASIMSNSCDDNPFFVDDQLSPQTIEIVKRLEENEQGKRRMIALAAAINQAEILTPFGSEDQQVHSSITKSLFKINETAFNSLNSENFLQLRTRGALPLIFCHLLSMQNLRSLIIKKSQIDAQSVAHTPSKMDIEFSENDIFNFDSLRSKRSAPPTSSKSAPDL